jgi:hypothetical protein
LKLCGNWVLGISLLIDNLATSVGEKHPKVTPLTWSIHDAGEDGLIELRGRRLYVLERAGEELQVSK